MAAKGKTISKAHREQIRQAALARHAERKAAGLLAPSGLPYITPPEPPTPEPVDVPEPAGPPAPLPQSVAEDARVPATGSSTPVTVASPLHAFNGWLRGHEGRSASDPRMSQDPVRQGAELEDRLRSAYLAGHAEGRGA